MSVEPPGRGDTYQQGVALITAMLVVAIATVTVVAMMSQQHMTIRRTGSLLYSDQAFELALGVEAWAKGVLIEDLKTNKFDGSGDLWTRPLPQTEVRGGEIGGRIEDLQGRFNLNNLIQNGKVDDASVGRFKRLLRMAGVDEGIAQAVLDWMDADNGVRFPDGAEDAHYKLQQPPYLAANRMMTSVSELRMIKGIDNKMYIKLRSHLTALPERTAINVNSATPLVLASLGNTLAVEHMRQLIERTTETPWDSLDAFRQEPEIGGLDLADGVAAVSSNYFSVTAEVRQDYLKLSMSSRLQRTNEGKVSVLSRVHRGGDE
ncbi:MAG: type II secretion system minor pseudopilin GspK [Sedimenticola sp.]